METLELAKLVERFEFAMAKGYQYVAVAVHVDDYDMPEIIINPYVNFEKKLAYYQSAYNADGTLKANPKIRLVMCACSNYIDKLNIAIIEYFDKIKIKDKI